MPMVNDQIKFYLSGGPTNTSPYNSIGGEMSEDMQVRPDEFNNIFGDLGPIELRDGVTQYRLIYVKNENVNTKFLVPRAFYAIQDPYTTVQWTERGNNKKCEKLATERTAPSIDEMGKFSTPFEDATDDFFTTKAVIPDLAPRSFRGLWIKRTLPPGNTVFPTEKMTFRIEVKGGGGALPPSSPTPPPEQPEPPPSGGCIPDGWTWPNEKVLTTGSNAVAYGWPAGGAACGHSFYKSPNTIEVAVRSQGNEDEGWKVTHIKPDDAEWGFGDFVSKDNAEAYKQYLLKCEKPRCDGNGSGGETGSDGITILNMIDTKSIAWNIAGKDLTKDQKYWERDDDGLKKKTQGSLTYWEFAARDGGFASGGSNRTARPEFRYTNKTRSGVSGAKSRGFIGVEDEPRDIEFTAVARVHGIGDDDENYSIKCRGDDHSDANEKTLTMSFGYPYKKRKRDLYDVELSHPSTDYFDVNIRWSDFPLPDEDWIGIKCIIYNIKNNDGIHAELWADPDPILSNGKFRNNWKKVWDYEESKSKTVTWAGPVIQFRVDQAERLDIAAFGFVSILAPKGTAVQTINFPLRTDADPGTFRTDVDGDIIYPPDEDFEELPPE